MVKIYDQEKILLELKKEKDFSNSVLSTAQTIILILNKKGKIIYFNPYMENISGYKLKEVKGKDWFSIFLPKKDSQKIKKLFLKAINNIKTKGNVNPIITKKGEKRYIEWYDKTLNINNNFIGLLSIGQDITEKIKIQEELEDSEYKYRRLFETSKDGILLVDVQTGRILDVNPYLLEMLGYSHKEYLGKKLWEISPLKDVIKNKAKFKELQKKKYVTYRNLPLETKKGKLIHVEFVSNVYSIEDRKIIQCNIRDSTERVKAEEEIIKQQEKYFAITTNAKDSIFVKDKNRRYTYVNKAMGKLLGFPVSKIIGKKPINIFGKDGEKVIKEVDERCFNGEEVKEIKTLNINKKKYIFDLVQVPIRNEKQEIIGITGIVRDITERAKEHDIYEKVVKVTSDMIQYVSPNGKLLFVNHSWLKKLGYTKKEAKNMSVWKVIHPDSLAHCKQIFTKLMKGEEIDIVDAELITKKGEKISVEGKISLNKDKGKIISTIGFFRDVTKELKAEKKLKYSEKRFEDIAMSSGDWVWEVDTKGKYTFVSGGLNKILGYSSKEIIGKSPFYFMPKNEAKRVRKIFLGIVKNKKNIVDLENWNVTKKGKRICLLTNGVPILDESGKLLGYRGIDKDITSRKANEAKLEEYKVILEQQAAESKSKYKTLFESSADAIMTLAPPIWRFNSGNPATIKMFKTGTEKEFTALGPWEISPKYQPDGQLSAVKAKKMIAKAMKEGTNYFEWTHKRLDGEAFPTTVLLTRLEIGGKKLLQATVRDITKEKKTEAKIESQIERLKELDVLKTQFLSTVSHELRTPLTPIRSQVQRMLDVDLSKEQRNRSLEMVMRNTLRLDRLIQDILEISRIQSGRLRIVKRKENFEFVLEEAINMIKPLANEKKVKIDVKIDHIPKIPIDKDRIIEVLTNLIHNALNYGDRKNRIKVIVKEERGFIKVSVKDKGKGIKEENLQNIFKPFFRERSVWESKIEGSGLGLSICRGIVRSHGGEIGVKSVLKKGSEFYFTLPIKSKKIKIKETEVL